MSRRTFLGAFTTLSRDARERLAEEDGALAVRPIMTERQDVYQRGRHDSGVVFCSIDPPVEHPRRAPRRGDVMGLWINAGQRPAVDNNASASSFSGASAYLPPIWIPPHADKERLLIQRLASR